MNRNVEDIPEYEEVLVSVGSKTSGHLWFELAWKSGGITKNKNGERIEQNGYVILGWLPLPQTNVDIDTMQIVWSLSHNRRTV